MLNWANDKLRDLGASTELVDIGMQTVPGECQVELPPVLLGSLGSDPRKKTVFFYGHLDVGPATKDGGAEPFSVTEKDGNLSIRGSTDGKSSVVCWIHALEAYKATGIDIPVNVKFAIEGMGKSGSEGLEDLLWARKDSFLRNIDYVCLSHKDWSNTAKSSLTYGLGAICYFQVEVSCAAKDLHSGVCGGTVYEGMADLIYLMNTLVDVNGRILIDGIYDNVTKAADQSADRVELLKHLAQQPSLSLHGIQGAYSDPGEKTVIPRKVIGKFSIKLAPNMTPDDTLKKVTSYLNKKWADRGTPNSLNVTMSHRGKMSEDSDHPHYVAGQRATEHLKANRPLKFDRVPGGNILLLPVCATDVGADAGHEKLNIQSYVEDTKLLGSYLYEVAQR